MSYVISESEERFSSEEYETKEQAIAAAPEELDLPPGAGFCVGEKEDANPVKWMPDADEILDLMGDRAYEEAGEVAEDWPSVGDAAKTKLTDAIRETILKWMKETGNEPNFYLVRNIESAKVPEEGAF